jgi:cytochrome d ubiquinol oxidase subunit II
MEPLKYLHNFMQMPIILSVFLLGVLLVIFGIFIGGIKKSSKSFWITIIGVISVVFSLFIIAGLNNTSFYPSTYNLESSLTIFNSSSSKYTLTIMSYVSLFIPFVLAYIWYIWKIMSKKKINKAELDETGHTY